MPTREAFRTESSCRTSLVADRTRLLRTPVDRAHGLDRVGLARPLVRAVALHSRESQRHAARIARARLHAVEGDLDDELRTDVHDVGLAVRLEAEQVLRLPGQHLVGHALEGLAEHDVPAGLRIARAEVEIRELA